jgi:hypothetical protein
LAGRSQRVWKNFHTRRSIQKASAELRTVAHQAAQLDKLAQTKDRGQAVAGRERHNLPTPGEHVWRFNDQKPANSHLNEPVPKPEWRET